MFSSLPSLGSIGGGLRAPCSDGGGTGYSRPVLESNLILDGVAIPEDDTDGGEGVSCAILASAVGLRPATGSFVRETFAVFIPFPIVDPSLLSGVPLCSGSCDLALALSAFISIFRFGPSLRGGTAPVEGARGLAALTLRVSLTDGRFWDSSRNFKFLCASSTFFG